MRNRITAMGALLWVILFASASLAQSTASNAGRAADGPDSSAATGIAGVWNAKGGLYHFATFTQDEPPMTAWGQEQFNATKPSQGPRGVKLNETNDPVYKCAPAGVPYIYFPPFPVQIIVTSKEVIEFFEYDHTVRHIFVDGRKHPPDVTPTYNGDSIGHWEGDTLVVDTVGLNGKAWLDRAGHPESDQMHLTERIHRADPTTLQVDITFDDPKSYTRPWNATVLFRLHPDWEIMEHVCEDSFAFEGFEK